MDSSTTSSQQHQHINFNFKRRFNCAIGEASKFVGAHLDSLQMDNLKNKPQASVRLHRQQRYADTSQYYATISVSAGAQLRRSMDAHEHDDAGAVGQVVRRSRRRVHAQVQSATMTKELLSRNEFDPNKCHQQQHHQVTSEQLLLATTTINDEQQVVEILSDDDDEDHREIINLTSSDHQVKTRLHQMDANKEHSQQHSSSSAESTPTQRKRAITSSQNTATAAPQYFIRYSLNNSIRSRHNHLKRASRRSTSTARTSVRRRSGRQARQVRFQPVAQAIDISIEQSNTSADDSLPVASGERAKTGSGGGGGGKQFVRVQQQLHRLGRKTRLRNYLAGSAKPQLNHPVMSQLKQLTGKIKLKSFNSLATQLQQTFSTGSSASVELATSGCTTTTTTSTQHRPTATHKLASKGFRLLAQKAAHAIASTGGTTISSSATGSGPIQRTFHLRHSAASARNQLTLSGGATGSEGAADEAISQQEDEDGWGSDFDESSKPDDEGDDSDVTQDDTIATEGVGQVEKRSGGRYLLEIGKSSCDSRAIHDVIQDQGLSGQFKRLDLSGDLSPEAVAPEPEVAVDEDEEDDAAELASLEARQNYRQVRDKLKLILDQRLASYERAAVVPAGDAAAAAASAHVTQPEVQVNYPATSSIDIRATGSGQVAQHSGEPAPVPVTGQVQVIVAVPVAGAAGVASTQTAPGKNCDRFDDCQSNCSEASSLSSNGLDSNHSGSQDSGHSTQHSGYSASGSTSGGSGGQVSPSTQLDSGASTCGDHEQVVPVAMASALNPKSSSKEATTTMASGSCVSEEEKERRDRFKQNRSIINSKLESMFKSRSTSALHCSNSTSRSSLPAQANDSPKSVQSCPTSTPAPASHAPVQRRPISLALGGSENKLEAAIRLRLLEQQRQMSLKLKQKPRRRSAKRALNLISSPSPVCSMDDGGSSINSCTTNASLDQISTQSSCGLPSSQAVANNDRDTLTKQLSMVCLRRLAAPAELDTNRQVVVINNQQVVNQQQHQQLKPKPALSLRQLVKEVIDDCETPGKLSTLTRNILNRSDSLSSEALSSSDLSPVTKEAKQIQDNNQEFKSSSPLKRINNCDNSITTSGLSLLSTTSNGASQLPTTPQQIKPIGLIPNQQLQHNPQFSTPFQRTPTTNIDVHNYQPADHSLIMTTTSSSLGTIDGLEYSPSPGACTPLDQSSSILAEQQPPSCLKQSQKATTSSGGIGSYWKNLRHFSRFKMNKVNMAYLDNTNNFFTDDDN